MRQQSTGVGAAVAVIATWAVCVLGFWGTVIYVLGHFIGKFW